jgi:signal transduction histidine kinase
MTPQQAAAIGRLPRGMGLLGAVVREGRSVRVKDLHQHPSSVGFPPHHPPMTSFLGVPVRYGGRTVGHLYLTNKRDGDEFTDEDERITEMLADRGAIAMEIARLSVAAQSAIQSRDNLLAVVSHDLRNPLSAIRLTATHLASKTEVPQEALQHLDVISRAAERMNRLIGDLLNASSIEAGTFTVQAQAEEVPPVVRELVEAMRPAAVARSIQLDYHAPDDLPRARCDRQRLAQVLSNVVDNAVKFTPDGGRIHIDVRPDGAELCFEVIDSGVGIPAEDLPHLFDRYWKGTTGRREGTGLGLYIARGIVEAHGGSISVTSQPGVGTTFSFTIPAERPGADDRRHNRDRS